MFKWLALKLLSFVSTSVLSEAFSSRFPCFIFAVLENDHLEEITGGKYDGAKYYTGSSNVCFKCTPLQYMALLDGLRQKYQEEYADVEKKIAEAIGKENK